MILRVRQTQLFQLVRQTLRQLSNRQYRFTDKELNSMLSKQWSKEVLNIDYPLLRKVEDDKDISVQIKDGMYGRIGKRFLNLTE